MVSAKASSANAVGASRAECATLCVWNLGSDLTDPGKHHPLGTRVVANWGLWMPFFPSLCFFSSVLHSLPFCIVCLPSAECIRFCFRDRWSILLSFFYVPVGFSFRNASNLFSLASLPCQAATFTMEKYNDSDSMRAADADESTAFLGARLAKEEPQRRRQTYVCITLVNLFFFMLSSLSLLCSVMSQKRSSDHAAAKLMDQFEIYCTSCQAQPKGRARELGA